jgi:hypothetical protein
MHNVVVAELQEGRCLGRHYVQIIDRIQKLDHQYCDEPLTIGTVKFNSAAPTGRHTKRLNEYRARPVEHVAGFRGIGPCPASRRRDNATASTGCVEQTQYKVRPLRRLLRANPKP